MTVNALLHAAFYLLSAGIALYTLWICAVWVAGSMSPKKTCPPAPPQNIAVMICARNEAPVIGHLIDSLKLQNYPKENYQIFVVAHNCDDPTAEIAAAHGATVFVRNAPEENRKAQALQYGLSLVREKFGAHFSYFAVFDADCLVHRDFLKEINAGLATGADVASGYYASKNFEDSLVSRLAGTLYYSLMEFTCIPQNNLGLPVNVYGSGFAAKMSWSADFAQMDTLVEDFEFSTRLVMGGAKLIEVPSAIFYAEMPVTLGDALTQRRRWAVGDTQCFWKYRKELRRRLPQLGWSGLKQYVDLLLNPIVFATAVGILLGAAILLLDGRLASLGYVLLLFLLCYGFFVIAAQGTLKAKGKGIRENWAVCLLFPFWVLLSAVLGVESFFRKDIPWAQAKRVSIQGVGDLEELEKREKDNVEYSNSEKQ